MSDDFRLRERLLASPVQSAPRSIVGERALSASTVTSAWDFMFESTPVEPPTGSEVRLDNADPINATKLWARDTTVDGANVRNGLLSIEAGATIYVQEKDSSINWLRFETTGPPVGKTGYVEFPVEWAYGAGTLPEQRVRVVAITSISLPG